MKNGFTLVELSIVLVIIGLLIGGILVGQTLINSAQVQAQIKQFSQFDIAISNFREKYKKWPGDSPYHSAAGDGDGELESSLMNAGTRGHTSDAMNYEVSNFWRHLQQDGFLAKEYPTFSWNTGAGVRVNVHVPLAILGDGATGIAPNYCNSLNQTGCPSFKYGLANFEGSTTAAIIAGTGGAVATMDVADIAAIDNKLDDGIAYISSWTSYSPGNVHTAAASPSCYVASGTHYKYNLSSTTKCYFSVSMLATNGLAK